MCTKYAEIVIAMHYREPDASGSMRGGAMYTLKALGLPWLGAIFAALVSLAAFGIGNMVQAELGCHSLELELRHRSVPRRHYPRRDLRASYPRRHQADWRGGGDSRPGHGDIYLAGGLVRARHYASEVPAAIALVFEAPSRHRGNRWFRGLDA